MLLLLDIDGVMVSSSSWKPVEILSDGFPKFKEQAAFNLQKILSETDASIVLTTSHKYRFSIPEWKKIFMHRGIEAKIARLNDNIGNLNRKDEILRWVNSQTNISDFVILDDDKLLNDLPGVLKERLVLTSGMIGLSSSDAEQAISILKSQELVPA